MSGYWPGKHHCKGHIRCSHRNAWTQDCILIYQTIYPDVLHQCLLFLGITFATTTKPHLVLLEVHSASNIMLQGMARTLLDTNNLPVSNWFQDNMGLIVEWTHQRIQLRTEYSIQNITRLLRYFFHTITPKFNAVLSLYAKLMLFRQIKHINFFALLHVQRIQIYWKFTPQYTTICNYN